MAREIRQGLGLVCIAVVLLLIAAGTSGAVVSFIRGAGELCLIGGVLVVAVGLFRG